MIRKLAKFKDIQINNYYISCEVSWNSVIDEESGLSYNIPYIVDSMARLVKITYKSQSHEVVWDHNNNEYRINMDDTTAYVKSSMSDVMCYLYHLNEEDKEKYWAKIIKNEI